MHKLQRKKSIQDVIFEKKSLKADSLCAVVAPACFRSGFFSEGSNELGLSQGSFPDNLFALAECRWRNSVVHTGKKSGKTVNVRESQLGGDL